MTQELSDSIDDHLRKVYEIESNNVWRQINSILWMRPYFNFAGTETWIITVIFENDEITVGMYKQTASYSVGKT